MTSNEVLEQAKDKFPVVLVIGLLPDGKNVDIMTNDPRYPTINWLLNKTQLEILLHEKQSNKSVEPKEDVVIEING